MTVGDDVGLIVGVVLLMGGVGGGGMPPLLLFGEDVGGIGNGEIVVGGSLFSRPPLLLPFPRVPNTPPTVAAITIETPISEMINRGKALSRFLRLDPTEFEIELMLPFSSSSCSSCDKFFFFLFVGSYSYLQPQQWCSPFQS